MSIRGLIQDQVSEGFKKLGDLVVTVSYTPEGGGYNPATGTLSVASSKDAKAVITSYNMRQVNNTTIVSSDKQIIFPKKDLLFEMTVGGTLTDPNGSIYQIMNIVEDPAGATLTVQGRI